MTMSPTDAALVQRLRTGDLSALDDLFQRHAASLLALSTRLTASLQDAEDIVQDVFVGLPTALRSYSESGEFGSWLRRIAVRTSLMAMRRERRRQEVDIADHDPVQRQVDYVGSIALEDAINSLPEPQRLVFVLKEIGRYSHAEIAAELGIRTGTSEVRHHRAIRKLRQILSDDK